MVSLTYTEIGKYREEYYIKNDSLLFVYSRYERYKEPINVNVNPVISRVAENRYYFANNQLIFWLKDKQQMKTSEFSQAVKEVYREYEGYLKN